MMFTIVMVIAVMTITIVTVINTMSTTIDMVRLYMTALWSCITDDYDHKLWIFGP